MDGRVKEHGVAVGNQYITCKRRHDIRRPIGVCYPCEYNSKCKVSLGVWEAAGYRKIRNVNKTPRCTGKCDYRTARSVSNGAARYFSKCKKCGHFRVTKCITP